MAKLLKSLFAVFFIAFVAVVTWGNLSLPQKHWIMDKVGLDFDRVKPAQTETERPHSPLSEVKEVISNLMSSDTNQALQNLSRTFEQHALPNLCVKTTTRSINDVDKTSIFRWTDENGQVHFSDSRPKQQTSQDMTTHYASAKQYFRMKLESPEQGVPTLLGEQLQRDVNAIYSFLSDRLSPSYLRQVDLNLKVFNTASGFEDYRKIHAPSLNSVAGFYTSRNNEAVVMQQRHDQQTRAIARHEATHVINAGLFGRSPIWFNEGIAEYFESYSYAELKNRITPAKRYHLNHLTALLEHNQLPTLQDYLQLSEKEWRAREQQTMYGMAWSVMFVLLEHQAGEQFVAKLMAQMAEHPCQAIDPIAFWQQHYPGGLTAFEHKWRTMLLANR